MPSVTPLGLNSSVASRLISSRLPSAICALPIRRSAEAVSPRPTSEPLTPPMLTHALPSYISGSLVVLLYRSIPVAGVMLLGRCAVVPTGICSACVCPNSTTTSSPVLL